MKKKDKTPLVEEVASRRAKRKKNPTACIDKKRSYWSCGICGSENLVSCGVLFCNHCGDEMPFVREGGWFFSSNRGDEQLVCSCDKLNQMRSYYLHQGYAINVCVDCDAIEGPLCPNCKRKCWAKGSKRYCKSCGYRSL